jgi:hypothetical protein
MNWTETESVTITTHDYVTKLGVFQVEVYADPFGAETWQYGVAMGSKTIQVGDTCCIDLEEAKDFAINIVKDWAKEVLDG